MGDNTADTSVVDAVPASDSAAKRLTGDERRREILDAVRTVSSELGVSHLSVSAVTKRAGCTRSLFYHYFADMDAAVTAVMDEAIDGFIAVPGGAPESLRLTLEELVPHLATNGLFRSAYSGKTLLSHLEE